MTDQPDDGPQLDAQIKRLIGRVWALTGAALADNPERDRALALIGGLACGPRLLRRQRVPLDLSFKGPHRDMLDVYVVEPHRCRDGSEIYVMEVPRTALLSGLGDASAT